MEDADGVWKCIEKSGEFNKLGFIDNWSSLSY